MGKMRERLKWFAEEHPVFLRGFYMAATAAALLTSLGLILVMVFHRESETGAPVPRVSAPPSPPGAQERGNSLTISFSDDEMTALLALALKEKLPLSDFRVAFEAPDRIRVGGKIAKSDLAMLAREEVTTMLKAALLLAPETIEADFVFALSETGGELCAIPEEVTVGGISVMPFLPEETAGILNDAIRSFVPAGTELMRLEISDGSVTAEIRTAA